MGREWWTIGLYIVFAYFILYWGARLLAPKECYKEGWGVRDLMLPSDPLIAKRIFYGVQVLSFGVLILIILSRQLRLSFFSGFPNFFLQASVFYMVFVFMYRMLIVFAQNSKCGCRKVCQFLFPCIVLVVGFYYARKFMDMRHADITLIPRDSRNENAPCRLFMFDDYDLGHILHS